MAKRRSAIWLSRYYHWVAKTLGLEQERTAGDFIEAAIEEYLIKNYPERTQEFYLMKKKFEYQERTITNER